MSLAIKNNTIPYLIIFLIGIIGIGYVFATENMSAAFLYAAGLGFGCIFFAYFYWFFFLSKSNTYFGQASPKLALLALMMSLIGGLVLEFLTLVGAYSSSPLDFSDWSKKRFVIFAVLSCIILTSIIRFFNPKKDRKLLETNYGVIIVFVSAVGLCLLLVGLGFFVSSVSDARIGRTVFLIACMLFSISAIYYFEIKNNKMHHFTFLVLAILVGTFLAFSLPPLTAISWDDQIHFNRSYGLSYLGHTEYTPAEIELTIVPWVENSVLQYDEIYSALSSLDAYRDVSIDMGNISENIGLASIGGGSLNSLYIIGYIPSAIGLWFGRLLGFPLLMTVILGRWFNLLVYVLIVAFAIKIIPVKKVLMGTIALLPTSLYLASNYSYDPIVTAFLMLAIAFIVREIKDDNSYISLGTIAAILLSFFIALCPKAIYFPLIGLLFLIPKTKFKNKNSYSLFLLLVILFGLFVVASFIAPMFFVSGGQTGDVRGGSDVSVSGQIAYIMSNPWEFLNTLVSFNLQYISPINSDGYTVYFAYMGSLVSYLPFISTIPFIILVIISIYDREFLQKRLISPLALLWVAIICFGTAVLVSLSMYLSFTPVGLKTINGAQPRYLIPLLFPALMLIGGITCKRKNIALKRDYVLDNSRVGVASFSLLLFLSFLTCWFLVIPW